MGQEPPADNHEDRTIECPNCGQVVREHFDRFDPSRGPDEEPCPACGEVVDLFAVAHEQWLDSLTASQGPPDLVLTGVCPGCGASSLLK